MRLHELQRAFQARILSFEAGIEPELDNRHDVDFEPRLDSYVGGYRTRLVEALGSTYPVLQMTLGGEEFARQMRGYIDATHSRHFSVRDYGADIPEWLAAGHSGRRGAQLAELACWEWILADVFDAPDDAPLDASTLATVPADAWPDLSFTLRACVRRCDTSSNVVECWRAANGLCDPPAGLTDAASGAWLVWRRGIKTLFRSLDAVEAIALDAAAAGASFGKLCERIAPHVPEAEIAFRAASLLRGWIAEELIADYSLPIEAE